MGKERKSIDDIFGVPLQGPEFNLIEEGEKLLGSNNSNNNEVKEAPVPVLISSHESDLSTQNFFKSKTDVKLVKKNNKRRGRPKKSKIEKKIQDSVRNKKEDIYWKSKKEQRGEVNKLEERNKGILIDSYILDKLARELSAPTAVLIYMYFFRRTISAGKEEIQISTSLIMDILGISVMSARTNIKILEEFGLLKVEREIGRPIIPCTYRVLRPWLDGEAINTEGREGDSRVV